MENEGELLLDGTDSVLKQMLDLNYYKTQKRQQSLHKMVVL